MEGGAHIVWRTRVCSTWHKVILLIVGSWNLRESPVWRNAICRESGPICSHDTHIAELGGLGWQQNHQLK
jgi:hypothetical protein